MSVHHAQPRDTVTEQLTLHAFMNRCEAYFGHGDVLIDQPFQSRSSKDSSASTSSHIKSSGSPYKAPVTY